MLLQMVLELLSIRNSQMELNVLLPMQAEDFPSLNGTTLAISWNPGTQMGHHRKVP